MSVLLMRLAGPLQSWGSSSRFVRRATEREPTKSGVLGLAAAALGRGRGHGLADLAALRFAVRIDQIGSPLRDYHTARKEGDTFVSERFYLADAVFVAALDDEGKNGALLRQLDAALRHPAFPLFLGRRSCPPTGQVALGVLEGETLDALADPGKAPWQAANWYRKRLRKRMAAAGGVHLEIVRDAAAGEPGAFFRRDAPESFCLEYRRYGFRSARAAKNAVHIEHPVLAPSGREAARCISLADSPTEQDPFSFPEADDDSVTD